MQNVFLLNVNVVRDLGINVTNYLSPSDHICEITAKAHKRALFIHRCFVSRNTDLLVRAFKVYIRTLLEYNSVIWSPSTIQDIEVIESVQRVPQRDCMGFIVCPTTRVYSVYICKALNIVNY